MSAIKIENDADGQVREDIAPSLSGWAARARESLGILFVAFITAMIGVALVLLGLLGLILSLFLSFAEIDIGISAFAQSEIISWGMMIVGTLIVFLSFFFAFIAYAFRLVRYLVSKEE